MASISRINELDLISVRLFLDVVELGSVSKAAGRHRMTQPSATMRLQKLERQLGLQLLDRGPNGSTATAAGVRLVPGCADLVAAGVALADRAQTVALERQRLVLAVTRHVADHFLSTWIAAADLVEVGIDLVEGDTLAVAHTVRTGAADLGWTDGPADPLTLRSVVVASEEIVPVVGRGHPWYGRRRAVTGADLVGATLTLPRPGSGTRDVVTAALAPFELGTIGDRIEVSSSAAARIAALGGSTVAFLPRCRVADELAAGTLAVVATRGTPIVQQVRAVWRGARPPAGPARRLLMSMGARSPG